MGHQKGILFFLLFSIAFMACRRESDSRVKKDTILDESIVHFDDELVKAVEDDSILRLLRDHPIFTEVYAHKILVDPRQNDMDTEEILSQAVRSGPMQRLRDTVCAILCHDMSDIEHDMSRALSRYAEIFPESEIPDVYTCITEFGVGAFSIEEAIIGLGLEFYLGEDFPYPDISLFPFYMRKYMTREYMVMRGMQALLEEKLPYPKDTRMIDLMCRNGKLLYLLTQILDFQAEHVALAYTEDEMKWCLQNESEMWTFFIEQDLLYETEQRRIHRYLHPAPHSAGMPDGAPGRTASWMGYRIIKKLMDNNSMSIQDLLLLEDGQEILEMARYKGR